MGWIKSGDRTLSGAEFHQRALRAAGALEALGVRKGDGVALYLRNELAYFEAAFGVGMLGAYSIPVNWHYTADEAGYLLRDSEVGVLLIHADLLGPVASAIPENVTVVVVETPPEVLAAYDIAPLAPPPGALIWRELVEQAQPLAREPEIAPSSIIYTSGTTGRPKGVRRPQPTPEQVAATNAMLGWSYGYTDHLAGKKPMDSITTAVIGPVYHAAPNAHSAFSIRMGANVIVTPRFSPEGLLRLIEKERVTHLNMVPIMFK
ncbi:AMP-binding protein, partial [Camelimonas abortus]